MIEYDRYVWLKSDQVNFGQNRKYLYLTCHVVIPSHLYNHRRDRALLSFTLVILYALPPTRSYEGPGPAVLLCAGFWGVGKGVSNFTSDFG